MGSTNKMEERHVYKAKKEGEKTKRVREREEGKVRQKRKSIDQLLAIQVKFLFKFELTQIYGKFRHIY